MREWKNYIRAALTASFFTSNTTEVENPSEGIWKNHRKKVPANTIPPDLVMITSSGAKIMPLSFVPDSMGGNEFDLIFPRNTFEKDLKFFKLQIPSPGLGDYTAKKAIAEFKLDKMTFEGKSAF